MDSKFLEDLSPEDLGQRYNETFAYYNNEAVYIRGFAYNGRKIEFSLSRINQSGTLQDSTIEFFDCTKLDVRRPPSKWYMGEYPFFLSYAITRQWSRGLTNRLINLYTSSGFGAKLQYNAQTIFNPKNWNMDWRNTIDFRTLKLFIQDTKQGYLASPFLLVSDNLYIYYKNKVVARCEEEIIHTIDPLFEQEIKECILGVEIKKEPYKEKSQVKKESRKEWYLNLPQPSLYTQEYGTTITMTVDEIEQPRRTARHART